MDETEKWIMMCERAEEIQKRQPFLTTLYSVNIPEYDLDGNCWLNKNNKCFIWLPRQDQLQDMLKITHLTNPYNLIGFLWNVLNENETCPDEEPCEECIKEAMYWRSFESLEQLWLAFIMRELYLKIWNGKNWIKD